MIAGFYKFLTILGTPLLARLPYWRAKQGKDIPARVKERFGISAIPRPQGKLVWFHAASNGESLSALPLITALMELPSAPTILVTTMTVTAARLMDQRLPEGCIHQFIPLDHPKWIEKFHDHWQPDLVLWIESELWPNHLRALKERNIPSALLNARLSDKSVGRWKLIPAFFQSLLSCFSIILAQTPRDQNNLQSLGVSNVTCKGNLKDIAIPLPFDPIAFDDLRLCTAGRTIMLYASTHDGEEMIAARIHQRLKSDFPNLLSIVIPRHPKRGPEIIAEIQKETDLILAQRSLKMSPRINTDVYLVDTLGELGLFYSLCDIVFVGNSMNVKPGGGHNLLEPALLNCSIISGNDLHNFSTLADEMPKANACTIVDNEDDLYTAIKMNIENDTVREEKTSNAFQYALKKQEGGLGQIFSSLHPLLNTAKLL